MPKHVTLDDVARAAGVSRASASRALGGGSASEEMRALVAEKAAELGFVANQAARTLASSRSNAIALVIPEPNSLVLGDPFLGGTIMGISEAFHTTDYQMILIIMRPDEDPSRAVRLLRPGHVDGAIIVSHHRGGALQNVKNRPAVPTVYIGRPEFAEDRLLYVDVDNEQIGRLAASRLVSQGAKRVACVAGPADMAPVEDRTAGWAAVLTDSGLPLGPIEHEEFTLQGGVAAMRRILASGTEFDAVFTQSDLMASGAIQVLAEAGLQVPEDIKIVSVDDSEVAQTSTPQLTSVTNPATELAVAAAELLLSVLDGSGDSRPTLLQPALVIRDSG